MKNNFILVLLFVSFSNFLFAEEFDIKAKNISIDKKKSITIFEGNVELKDEFNNLIKSDYVEYNKITNFLKLQGKIIIKDKNNNIFNASVATYDNNNKLFKSSGESSFETIKGYKIKTSDLVINYKNFSVISNNQTTIKDLDGNSIKLENFEYLKEKNIFKSIGKINLTDKLNNIYKFSQLYIDEEKQEIIGSDAKIFINNEDFKINNSNKPRIFANTISINNNTSTFVKSNFTMCDYRQNDKCPPWEMKASKMTHDAVKKTIYYDKAVIKLYNLPIFYFPKLSHPDPSVDRRSGFLIPSYTDTKNLGSGLNIPYFWAINKDKDLTFTNKLFVSEHPLFLGEYRQAFEKSNLILDTGYTKGYKNSSTTKKSGDKSHFFSKFVKNFNGKNNSENNFSIKTQQVSNNKYLKLYRIKSSLADYNQDTLENSLNFTHENDDYFFGFNTGIFETLKSNYNDKYEYILPEITFDKNLFSNNILGNLDLQSNIKLHNYDTNKTKKLFVNNLDWNLKTLNFDNGVKSELKSELKNVNYEVQNIDGFKEDSNNEFFGAIGFLTKVDLFKKFNNSRKDIFTPKILVRYAPGQMRKDNSGSRLNSSNIFLLDRLNNNDNFESGLSATVGFDYTINDNDKKFDFSLGQIINEKENKNMPSITSLDEKLSDLVGSSSLTVNDKVSLNHNFSLDQNYKDLNYNEIGSTINLNPINFDFNYLQEKKHIGNQEYFKAKIDINKNSNGLLSLETKRNLVTNSSEYYNLSYEYLNDCLRAGLVFRREFYNDSELEPENSLMFKITLVPFANISTPSFNK